MELLNLAGCMDSSASSYKRYDVTSTPNVAKFMLNMPLVQIDSVGAGCGSYVRIDPNGRRPEVGPDSAGAMIGTALGLVHAVAWAGRGDPRLTSAVTPQKRRGAVGRGMA